MTFKEFKALNPYHGMPVRCVIDGIEITDAKLSKNEHGEWFVSQNIRNGTSRGDKLGYLYNFCIFWGNKGDGEKEESLTSLTPLNTHPLAGIKAGDLLVSKDGYFRRALSDVMYPQLGELATVSVSFANKNKEHEDLKKCITANTLFELQQDGFSIHKEEEKPAMFVEEEIVEEILYDLTDRRGLRQAWGGIDDDLQEEIKKTWHEIIKKHL